MDKPWWWYPCTKTMVTSYWCLCHFLSVGPYSKTVRFHCWQNFAKWWEEVIEPMKKPCRFCLSLLHMWQMIQTLTRQTPLPQQLFTMTMLTVSTKCLLLGCAYYWYKIYCACNVELSCTYLCTEANLYFVNCFTKEQCVYARGTTM